MAECMPERIVAVERIGVSSVSAQERRNRNKQNSVSVLARVYVEQIATVNKNVASKVQLASLVSGRRCPAVELYKET
jgi:hypothetical protein